MSKTINKIKKNIWVYCFYLILLYGSTASYAQARWGVNIASGIAANDIHPYRVAAVWSFNAIDTITASNWRILPLWETSLGYWDGKVDIKKGGNDQIIAVTTGPLFRWQHEPNNRNMPSCYLEIGIAVSWLSNTDIAGRKLSTHFQFEDKGGVGLRFGQNQQYDIGLRVIHYSNASIKRPNNGVNMLLLSMEYWL